MAAVIIGAVLFAVGVPLLTIALGYWSEHPGTPKPKAVDSDSTTRPALIAGAIWAGVTALGLWFSLTYDFYPVVASDKAREIADAFRILMVFSAPVFAMVVAVLVYTFLRRGYDDVPPDGPPLKGRGRAPIIWFLVTSALTAVVIVFPGLTSLHSVEKAEDPDLVVQVKGIQWTWLVSYPDLGIENVRELMLPVDRNVRFEITSGDVLHSFWIPAFLMKVDAVPGLTTTLSLRPEEIASFDTVPTMRVQCAELCGTSHSTMRMPVSVVSQADFDAWAKENGTAPSVRSEGGGPMSMVSPAGVRELWPADAFVAIDSRVIYLTSASGVSRAVSARMVA